MRRGRCHALRLMLLRLMLFRRAPSFARRHQDMRYGTWCPLWPRAPTPVAGAAKGPEGADRGAQLFTFSLPSQDPAAAAAKVAELLRSFGVELCAPGSYVER